MSISHAIRQALPKAEHCDVYGSITQEIRREKSLSPSFPGLPLSLVRIGQQVRVTRIKGKEEDRRFLASLGFAVDSEVTVVSGQGGNVIASVKGARVAISKALASCIMTDSSA